MLKKQIDLQRHIDKRVKQYKRTIDNSKTAEQKALEALKELQEEKEYLLQQ